MDHQFSLLIAGCGYLGRRVASRLLGQGHTVGAITRSAAKLSDLAECGLRIFEADLVTQVPNLKSTPFDAVLWCIGYEPNSVQSRQQVWTHSIRNLLSAFTSSGLTRFVMTSSVSVYGDSEGSTVDEFTPCSPTTDGGKAILEAESLLRELLTRHSPAPRCTIARLAGIYGPNRLLRKLSDLEARAPITGPPDDWMNLIHVDDAAEIIYKLLRCNHPPELINLVSHPTVTRRLYYSTLADVSKVPAPIFAADLPESSLIPIEFFQRRQKSGNKKVESRCLQKFESSMKFQNLLNGLRQAMGPKS
ncbi:MAG: NAD-dependent epimerase/dehydratase family protein [Planctomyces sp.]|nr:NAD-dependent epimerase/dehydratase family protein [Planctomyces sp.]